MDQVRTMSREETFYGLKYDAWYGRLYNKLTLSERSECIAFIITRNDLDFGQFENAAQRWYLDQPVKPRNLPIMTELVNVANAKANKAGKL
jgi:hypothetical protein